MWWSGCPWRASRSRSKEPRAASCTFSTWTAAFPAKRPTQQDWAVLAWTELWGLPGGRRGSCGSATWIPRPPRSPSPSTKLRPAVIRRIPRIPRQVPRRTQNLPKAHRPKVAPRALFGRRLKGGRFQSAPQRARGERRLKGPKLQACGKSHPEASAPSQALSQAPSQAQYPARKRPRHRQPRGARSSKSTCSRPPLWAGPRRAARRTLGARKPWAAGDSLAVSLPCTWWWRPWRGTSGIAPCAGADGKLERRQALRISATALFASRATPGGFRILVTRTRSAPPV
mmetsp:Transcript_10761/g.25153  ORF Transcript_10761/g.25153 Transcript_10761/m.25153 type:complete len:285 (+) Transcript_10761:736-1590(+)